MSGDLAQEVFAALCRAPRYRHLSADTLRRMSGWAAVRHPGVKDAVKAARRKLHQVNGAYLDRRGVARVEELLQGISPGLTDEVLRGACEPILACHASTRERLSTLKDLYPRLLRDVGAPASILDLACGLNPFTLPWMGLGPDTVYRAWDVDGRLIALVNNFMDRLGRPPGGGCRDLLVSMPEEPMEAVFLFKAIPCLEQQEKGVCARLLRSLRARWAVLSFPAQTLSGRDRGMALHYDQFMERILESLEISARKISYPTEIFYLCRLKD